MIRLFTEQTEESLASLSEVELIRSIPKWLGPSNPQAPEGIGDDTAVWQQDTTTQLCTVDSVVNSIHFLDTEEPELVGAKLLKRNLSDIAAMGGIPDRAVIALCLGKNVSIKWLEGFYRGISETAIKYDTKIVGGDISGGRRNHFSASLTLLGTAQKPLLRTGAKAEDSIWVTGPLGGSIRKRHLRFSPRLSEGQWLARQDAVVAMMDISDGLGKDLTHMLTDTLSAQLNTQDLPIHPDTLRMAIDTHRSQLDHALSDGEDHELLFILQSGTNKEDFIATWPESFEGKPICIGTIVERKEAVIIDENKQPIEFSGFDHYGS